jgi:hypothetical protein
MFYTILWTNEMGHNASDCAKNRLHRTQKIKQQETH